MILEKTAPVAEKGVPMQQSIPHDKGIRVEKAITILAPPEILYQFWRNFENLSRILHHVESVTVIDPLHSHWVVKAPAKTTVEWDAEIINEQQDALIAWRSVEDAQVPNAGSVHFEPTSNRGTVVRVHLKYDPPAGKVGALVAKLFGENPEQSVGDDLRRLKQLIETGEIATIQGQSSGDENRQAETKAGVA